MKLLTILIPTLTAIGLVAVGCGSDSTNNTPAAANCKGVYADKTATDFPSLVASSGACISTDDANAVCANDVNTAAATCGQACVTQGGDSATIAACTLDCIKGKTDPDPGDACLGCYIADVGCASQQCLTECLADATGAACTECRIAKGCAAAFYACSGLPLPTGFPTGGAGAAGASGAGPGEAGAGGTPGGAGTGGTAGASGSGEGGTAGATDTAGAGGTAGA